MNPQTQVSAAHPRGTGGVAVGCVEWVVALSDTYTCRSSAVQLAFVKRSGGGESLRYGTSQLSEGHWFKCTFAAALSSLFVPCAPQATICARLGLECIVYMGIKVSHPSAVISQVDHVLGSLQAAQHPHGSVEV